MAVETLQFALREHLRRLEVKAALRAELFDRQLAVLDDKSTRIALCCSRRAGKSEFLARLIAITLIDAGLNETVVFCARTLAVAKKIIWSLLCRINDKYKLGWKCSEHTGTIATPTGAVFQLVGVDDIASVEKVRGSKFRLAVCDEAATYQSYLERLVVDCLSPGCKDFDPPGRIVLAGTPGYFCGGYWYEASVGKLTSYSRHHWTIFENPHIPNAEAALAQERADNGWTEESPQYRREYLGEWLNDGAALVYAYTQHRNGVESLPVPFDPRTWLTTVGVDVGFNDDFAITVLGSPPHSRETFAVYCYKQPGLLAGEQAEHVREVCERYRPSRVVGDAGGQGKLVLEEFNARHSHSGYRIQAADKLGKVGAIGLMNSALRSGEMKLLLPSAEPLADEMVQLPWLDERCEKEHPAFANHGCDSALYAFRAHRAYWQKPAAPEKSPQQLADEARRERQRRVADRKSAGFFR